MHICVHSKTKEKTSLQFLLILKMICTGFDPLRAKCEYFESSVNSTSYLNSYYAFHITSQT